MTRKRPSWLMQLVRISEKGGKARRDGLPSTDCPYSTRARGLNRQRSEAWLEGWKSADHELDQEKQEMT